MGCPSYAPVVYSDESTIQCDLTDEHSTHVHVERDDDGSIVFVLHWVTR